MFVSLFISFHFVSFCLDSFNDDQWRATLDIKFIIHAIIQLLIEPEASDPLNVEAGKQAQEDKRGFEAKAMEWTKIYSQRECLCGKSELEGDGECLCDEIPKKKIQRIGSE